MVGVKRVVGPGAMGSKVGGVKEMMESLGVVGV